MEEEDTAYHYTTNRNLTAILLSGGLDPEASVNHGAAPREHPILWFSTEPNWEPTANKAWQERGQRLVGVVAVAVPSAAGESGQPWEGSTAIVNGKPLFTASTPSTGAEPDALPMAWTAGPNATGLGGGCGPSFDMLLRLSSTGQLSLGAVTEFKLAPCPPLTTTAWFRETGFAGLAVLGECGVQLSAPVLSAVLTAESAGAATWTPILPGDPALAGLPIRQQALVLDSAGPLFGAASLCAGLEVTLAP